MYIFYKDGIIMRSFNISFPGGRDRAFTLSYDDALDTDIDLIVLLNKYNVKCTFNLNGGMFNSEDAVRPYVNAHFRLPESLIEKVYSDPHCEVATHGFVHPRYERLTAEETFADILADRRSLERIFKKPIRGHAYPYGTYTKDTIDIFRLAGIAYARAIKETHQFDLPKDWYRWGTTCHHSVWDMPLLIDRFLNHPVPGDENGYLFYIWGHSHEFREDKNWYVIEDIFEKISGRDEVWYATNIEICDYCRAWENLIFSADQSIVYNPTAFDLWIKSYCDGEIKKTAVPSGATVEI